MKKTIFGSICAALLMLALLTGTTTTFTGCSTFTGITSTVTNITKLAQYAQLGAYAATVDTLRRDPGSRAYFLLSVAALNEFVLTSTNNASADLLTTLQSVPIQGINDANIQLAIVTIIGFYNINYQDAVKNGIAKNEAVTKLTSAIRDGISSGLITVPASRAFKMYRL